MYNTGIDYHKRYSIVGIQKAQDRIVRERQTDHTFPESFRG